MSYRVTKEHVWVCVIDDRPGALHQRLEALSASGVNLELIITRRERHGRALMFVSPLRSEGEIRGAHQAGLSIADSLHNLRIEGPNAVGLAAFITGTLGRHDVNMRGYSAASLGQLHVTNIAFDSASDADRAKGLLEAALPSFAAGG